MTDLTREQCEACSGSTPRLAPAEVEQLRGDLDMGWEVREGRSLRRELRFKTFSEAFAMATRVALLAEAEGHHPELTVGWGHLDVELFTHAVAGLTRNDFIFAAKLDQLTGA